MGNQINRQALPAAHCTTATGVCQGGNRPAFTGRSESKPLAVAGSWKGMARGT